jgi:hypothetical protein
MTLNGPIEIDRYILRPAGKEDAQKLLELDGRSSIIPMDEALGIDKLPYKMTARMMLEAAFWAQNQGSYERAQQILKRHNIEVNDDIIRNIVNHIGSYIFQIDCQIAEKNYEKLLKSQINFNYNINGVLYIETDGAALNTTIKSDDDTTWRENKLGIVFTSDNIRYWTDKHGNRQHEIKKREYTSFLGSVDYFKILLFSSALRNGYGKYKETVILSDGATWIRNMVKELYPDSQQILDFFHLCENIHNYSKLYFKKNNNLAKKWAEKICQLFKESKIEEAISIIYKLQTKYNIKPNLHKYISNNLDNIDYAKYIKKGFFIGSGAIESANKLVMQSRMKRPGQRWHPTSAQNMLTLRAKQESGLWQEEVVKPIMNFYSTPGNTQLD